MDATEKQDIERSIERARDGIGDRIDELDRHLRSTLDFKTMASEHAPEIVAGGALMGLLVGFGFPKLLKLTLKVGVPVALIGYAVKLRMKAKEEDELSLGHS
ncbi:MAG: hypothetical protein JOZ54_21725 [Acidobacteria bacterium]|nr:hypothetical protein [Acidobacteriota bacterium]